MKTILATVYSVNPYKGSEDGMGWNYVYQAARFNKVLAITRKNNRGAIEQYMHAQSDPVFKNLHFIYFDLPYWMRFWKKKSRGAILYYLLWQWFVPRFVKQQRLVFDIAHNLNFHNDWSPSFLWKLGKPFVWGPIGHHPLIPSQYLKLYAKKYWLKDRLTWMVKTFFWKYSHALKQTIQQADHIWCMNTSVEQVLDLKSTSYHIGPSVATQDHGWLQDKPSGKFTLISAGRLVPLKGYDLSILAFAAFLSGLKESHRSSCELLIIGSGPEEHLYKTLAKQKGIQSYVRFISWMERKELMHVMKHASAFMFPSHEGAGMVVPEALSFGLPVLCLDNCGPGQFIDSSCGFAVKEQEYDATVTELSQCIDKLYRNPDLLHRMSVAARAKFEQAFHWDLRGEMLMEIYDSVGELKSREELFPADFADLR